MANILKFCKYCGQNERMITKLGKISDFCSLSCRSRYHNKQTLEKRVKTNIKKYGVDNPSKAEEIKEKRKATNIKKYGIENPVLLPEIQEKKKKTCIARYGNEHPIKTDQVKQKQKDSWEEIYGSHPWANDSVREKRRKTLLARYGVEHPIQNQDIYDKIKCTNVERYGFELASQSDVIITKIREANTSKLAVGILDNASLLSALLEVYSISELSKMILVHKKTLISYLKKYSLYSGFKSSFESEVHIFLKKHNIKCISNNRSTISPFELDILLTDYNIAIECNGEYWHSESKGKDKHYHLNKTKLAKKQGIRLIHIWYHVWNDKQVQVEFLILAAIGCSGSIYRPRNTRISEISEKLSSEFSNKYHIGKVCENIVTYGLYDNDVLIAIMIFRLNDNGWELCRYVSKNGILINNGINMLFEFFIKYNKPGQVFGYADCMSDDGALYRKLGFRQLSDIAPVCRYTNDYVTFSETLPSSDGYDCIWDCGKTAWFLDFFN